MANLETLELTINANAQSASQGLGSLINSLTALSAKVGKTVGGLKLLNGQLATLKGNSNIKFTGLDNAVKKVTESGRKIKNVSKQIKLSAEDIYNMGNRNAVNRGDPNAKSDAQWKKEFEEMQAAKKAKQEADKAMYAQARLQRELKNLPIIKKLDTTPQASNYIKDYIEQSMGIGAIPKSAKDSASVFMEQMKESPTFAERAKSAFANFRGGIKEFGKEVKSVLPKFNGLHRAMRVASTMLLRTGIRTLFKGIKEGLGNYYQYSKNIGGEFSKVADDLSSAWATLKNQMGAAIAPALTAAIPVINSLASAATTAFNALSQLFALLTGKGSWSKATAQVNAFDAAAKKAGGGGGGIKELLAKFDELNIITSESGGGGDGSGSDIDYENMFTEMYQFDENIRSFANFLKDNFGEILSTVIAIRVGIAAWQLADRFAETLPLLSKIAGLVGTAAAIAVTLQLSWAFTNEYLESGNEGWLIADVFSTAVGSAAAWGIAKHFIGGNAGAYAATIALTFSAITGVKALLDNTDVSALSKEGILASIENALKVGAAGAILLKVVGGATMGTALAGGAAVAVATFGAIVGIKTALDPNVELFSLQSIVTAIGSAAAVGLGATILSGNIVVGAVAAIATLIAYVAIKATTSANKVSVDSNLIHLTEEEVDKFVRSKMFKVDPEIMISVTSNNISKLEADKADIEKELGNLLGVMNVVNLGLATSDDYSELKKGILGESGDGSGGLIGTVNKWISDAQQNGKLTLKFTPSLVGETEEEQKSWYKNYEKGWETVKGFMNNLGKQLADELVEGENGELIAKRPERVAKLLNEIKVISEILAGQDVVTEAQIDLDITLNDLDSSSFSQAMDAFDSYKKKMEEAAIDLEKTALANQTRLVNALKKMLELDPNNSEIKQQLAEAEEGLKTIKENFDEAVKKTMEENTAPGKEMFVEWVKKNFDIGNLKIKWDKNRLSQMLNTNGLEKTLERVFKENGIEADINDILSFGGWDWLSKDLQRDIIANVRYTPETLRTLKEKCKLTAGDITSIVEWDKLSDKAKKDFITNMERIFGSADTKAALKQKLMTDASAIVDIKNWDTFSTKKKMEYINSLVTILGGADTKKTIKERLSVDASNIIDIKSWNGFAQDEKAEFIKMMVTVFGGADSMKTLRNQLNLSADTICDIVKWNDLASSEKNEFIRGMVSAFGGVNAMSSLKNQLKITAENVADITNWNRLAMSEKNEFINGMLSVFGSSDTVNALKNTYSATEIIKFSGWDTLSQSAKLQLLTALTKAFGKDALDKAKTFGINVGEEIKKGMNSKDETVKSSAKSLAKAVQDTLDASKVTIDVSANISASIEAEVNYTLKEGATQKSSKVSSNVEVSKPALVNKPVTQPVALLKATGAYGIPAGDVFIANERGAELVGSINGKTSVANQGQIIEGIQRGVAEANSEQNALLRQQNELLRGILDKDSSVRLNASAALGRMVQQSLNMYGSMVGG